VALLIEFRSGGLAPPKIQLRQGQALETGGRFGSKKILAAPVCPDHLRRYFPRACLMVLPSNANSCWTRFGRRQTPGSARFCSLESISLSGQAEVRSRLTTAPYFSKVKICLQLFRRR
jgi:hypothetical protein